jgi:tRNA(Ile)-lysidine synthase
MVRKGDGVLVAVSGGADSVTLLHLFLDIAAATKVRLTVAHFNHRFRGSSSAADARFVRRLAESYRLPVVLGEGKGKSGPGHRGRSLQERARRERFSFLLATAKAHRCRRVAFGHNADDQAETMVMRFLGRAGPAGLGGIPPVSHGGRVIHPLLGIRRREIEGYLREKGIAHREDRTNAQPLYLRNRLRLDLLPVLKKNYNPNLVRHLGELAAALRRDNDILDEMAREITGKSVRKGDQVTFPPDLLRESHPALLTRVLLDALRSLSSTEEDFGSRHLDALVEGGVGSRHLHWDLPGGITASRDRRGLTLRGPSTTASPSSPFSLPLPVPGTASLPGGSGKVTASVRKRAEAFDPRALPGIPWRTALDWERVCPPLTVRSRRPGDRFRPLGLPGEKKLKEILIDDGVPRPLRHGLPVVCDKKGIVWLAGLRPCHRARVTKRTGKILFLRAESDLAKEL